MTVKTIEPAPLSKRTREVATYDIWFAAQIQVSIEDDRSNISDQDARAAFAKRKHELRKLAELGGTGT